MKYRRAASAESFNPFFEEQAMKANLMSMNILVDSSGSMESIASDMVGALNQLVDENRELDVLVTYSIFSDEYQPVFAHVPIKDVKRFELKPDRMTALVESACKMIDEVGARLAAMPEEERPEKVMFVIVTDGLENYSNPKYTRKTIFNHQTKGAIPCLISTMITTRQNLFQRTSL